MTNYYILHSGGLDSTTLLTLAANRPDTETITAIMVNYGQRHIKELEYAKKAQDTLGIKAVTLDLTGYGQSVTSALTSNLDVPDGHYTAETMKTTVVPGRNAVMLAAAAGLAASQTPNDKNVLLTAVHAGDHAIYPDCRPEFIDSISTTLELATGIAVEAPFVNLDKAQIVKVAAELGAPLHLTWSCYKGGEYHCGTCGTCVERREAFQLANIQDPTTYAN